ncbi:glycosyl transferase family 2 [Flammeovirgaceae bacterium 311]|nr:glycosyl transferase family 2 [Flammeovirgaceae bacterium 311]
MSKAAPDISIIIPCFNRERFITDTIESVLSQTYSNWELIVVDDGSTDNSIKILKSYSEKDERISYFERLRLPKGAPTCRNIGVENARGEYIIYLDSDDILAEYCLERRRSAIKDTTYDFCVFKAYEFKEVIQNVTGVFYTPSAPGKDHLSLFLEYIPPWQTMSPIWKKSFLCKVGGFTEGLRRFQDIDFHIKALALKPYFKVYEDLEPDCYYRLGTEKVNPELFLEVQTKSANKMIINILSLKNLHLNSHYKINLRRGILRLILVYFSNTRSDIWINYFKSIVMLGREHNILSYVDTKFLYLYLSAWSSKSSIVKSFKIVGIMNKIILNKISK